MDGEHREIRLLGGTQGDRRRTLDNQGAIGILDGKLY
jgi:hypothetical protein